MEEKDKKIFTVSASSLDKIDTCGQLYEYSKVQKLKPINQKAGLEYGGLMHFILHPYRFGHIKNIKDHHLAHPYAKLLGLERHQLIKVCSQLGILKSMTTDLPAEDRERCIEQFNEYCIFYSQRDIRQQTLEVEQPFTKKLYEDDNLIILFEGIIDWLVLDNDWGPVPYDTKTGKRDWFRPKTQNQLQGTCWAFETNKFMVDKVLDQKEEPFRRKLYSYMQEHLDEWREDAIKTAFKGISYIENNYFPRHRNACGNFGGCSFYDACKTNPSSRKFKLESFYTRSEVEFHLYSKDKHIPELLHEAMKVL